MSGSRSDGNVEERDGTGVKMTMTMVEENEEEEEEEEEDEEEERLSSYVPYVTYVRGARLPSVGDI